MIKNKKMNGPVLFISHLKTQCGVYQFGKDVFNAISQSEKYKFVKIECETLKELKDSISTHKPAAIIYNYHPDVMTWLCTKTTKGAYQNHIAGIKCPQIGIIHEITQHIADSATGNPSSLFLGDPKKKLNSLFDFYIAADPTLLLLNPIVFKTGRLVSSFKDSNAAPEKNIPVIGSFGFATANKGFEELVKQVQKEFDEAVIRINMPSAYFGDREGTNAKRIAEECRNIIQKKGIRLEISHDFLEEKNEMLNFLSGNSLNAFFYQDKGGRGLSSALDNALAVKKPIAVSNCPMFRHILQAKPSVCIENLSLKEILKNGFSPLDKLATEWNEENLMWEYERIMNTIFQRSFEKPHTKLSFTKKLKKLFRKVVPLAPTPFTWLRDTESASKDDLSINTGLYYEPIIFPEGTKFNRILDDKARELYLPAVEKLIEAVPLTMAKKIPRANVQQAFIFDTVYRLLQKNKNAKLLCVGSYEDTASMTLIKMGFNVEEIDPMLNYFLQDYYTKPSTVKNSYDIIFSTSVIEHDPDDKSFMTCIEGLLAPGGIGIITCDYKDGWIPGEPKPDVDERFYTKKDMEERLLSYIPDCELVDVGEWDCPTPDFVFINKYRYTFATFVFRKKNKA